MELRANGMALPASLRPADKPQAAVQPTPQQDIAGIVSPQAAQAVQPPPPGAPTELDDALRNINESMRTMSQSLEFSIDPDSDRTVVKVIDQQTKEVIRQMPSVEALEIAKALDRLQGLLIRQQA
ncbi:flagellar protein FlaG [Massilia sp. LjRoot122]|uniref:flagellar protein FlaG n=1 Tax=Massilia sp. LjRoot122 TaxID=3342257 RepID=UPI003ECEC3EE